MTRLDWHVIAHKAVFYVAVVGFLVAWHFAQ
jgi:hypothetical protein